LAKKRKRCAGVVYPPVKKAGDVRLHRKLMCEYQHFRELVGQNNQTPNPAKAVHPDDFEEVVSPLCNHSAGAV
jgi:hypothetical protein